MFVSKDGKTINLDKVFMFFLAEKSINFYAETFAFDANNERVEVQSSLYFQDADSATEGYEAILMALNEGRNHVKFKFHEEES